MGSHEDLDRFFRITNKGIKYLFCGLFARDWNDSWSRRSSRAYLKNAEILLDL
jgi:hypothetical protein